jgi:hypothetical protein
VREHRRTLDYLDDACDGMRLIGVGEQLARLAGALAERHALRGYDALHLASALSIGDTSLVLATWDQRLARAALAAGAAVLPAPS